MTDSIVVENLKEGTPREIWDADMSDQIEGFATDISVNHGTRVDFKINVNADLGEDVPYHVEIYRLGYYDGDGARLVQTINGLTGNAQPDPLTDQATGLVDAGNWSVSSGWDVPADAVSGVYLVKLVRDDNGATNQIPFIVRNDDGPKSDIVLQTSDTTWHAYNGWAGNNGQVGGNFYGDPSGTINHPDVADPGLGAQDRAYAVSYNRPFLTRDGGGAASGAQDYLFGADYAAIYWLEKNGYDVSYISGVDTDRLGADYLVGHEAFISVGHDEYWSGQQRFNVEEARDEGVNLLFWSGNEIYWKVRYEDAISADGTPYRTLVCYKETWANRDPNAGPEDYANIDPANDWTGTWRDMRFVDAVDAGGNYIAGGSRLDVLSGSTPNCNCITGAGPENSLTGQLFGPDGTGQFGAALDVPAALAGLRIWRDTTVAETGQLDIAPGILGYEWNTSPEDELRPAGLIKLSDTVDIPWNGILVDQGNQVQPGVATHNLSLYRAESGALVFGAGTVFWSWGLSDEHDSSPYGANIANVAIQQFTVNMFADMDIQPGVADAILASQGLVRATASTDTVAATTTLVDLQDVSALQTVTITGTATDDDGNAATADGKVAVVEVSVDGGATWRVAEGMSNWSYQWRPTAEGDYTIKARAIDDSLNITSITPATDTVHVTAPVPPDTFSLFDPSLPVTGTLFNDGQPIELGVKFTAAQAGEITELKYYRAAGDAGDVDVRAGHLWSSNGTLLATVTFTSGVNDDGWQVATLSNPVAILANTDYIVSYRTNDHYISTNDFFDPAREVTYDGVDDDAFTDPFGVLSAPQNTVVGNAGFNGNGVYKYGSTVEMPNETFKGSNYWVDVTFDPADGPNTAPSFTSPASFNAAENQTAAGTLTATDAEGNALVFGIAGGADAAKFTINPTTGALTFNTMPNFETPTDSGGNNAYELNVNVSDGIAAPVEQAITVNVTDVVETPVSNLFGPGDTPETFEVVDTTDYELGVKFEASQTGVITALRYFRGAVDADDTDIRTLNLWEADGDLLGSVTVTSGLNAIGWQVGTLTTPIGIQANTIYIASYGTTENYAVTRGDFATAIIGPDGVLTAPESVSVDGNGVFNFQQGPGFFPTGTFDATNYWIDVFFEPQSAPNTLPQITSNGGGATALITIDENTTLVGTVAATDPDIPAQTLTYSKAGGEDAALFTINATTGVLEFVSAPNFEALPNAGSTPGYQVVVQVSDGVGGSDQQEITVSVDDVSEIPAAGFDGKDLRVDYVFGGEPGVPASFAGSTKFITASAAPNTLDVPNIPDPEIGNGPFGLATVDFGTASVRIEYPLDASAFPGEVANFAPEINNPYNGVLITDTTNTLPAILGVTISQQAGFTIPLDSGNITFTADSIFVNVNDLGDGVSSTNSRQTDIDPVAPGRQPSFFTLDINFNAPVANADALAATEDTPVTYTAAQLLGNDTDVENSALTIATVTSGTGGTAVLNGDGSVTFTPAANFNGAADFSYTATDGTVQSAAAMVTVNVAAVNDAPVAVADTLSATEDTPVTYTAAQLLGNDTDVENSALTIATVTSGTGGTAVLNGDGSVTFTPAANFNGAADFTYTVTDGLLGSDPATVTVNVAPVNDAPVITSASTFSVAENTTAVGTVTATDADSPTVTFAITGGADQALFTIDANTGALAFAAAPDYETQAPSYAVQVTASDGTNPTVQNITVNLTDVNDNAPVITSASTFSVAENTTAVGTVTATDADSPTVTFAITGGADQALFTIDANTGALAFAAAPDYETQAPSYAVQVTASDGTNPTVQNITVNLTDVNDNAPVITSASTFSVAENTTAVGTVTATDADSPTVTFAITGGADQALFTIDANTGALAFAAAPDYETQAPSYAVQVTASDGTNPTVQNITVNLTDVNDNAPVITSASTFSVAENTTAVGTVTATDADSPTVTFAITGGADQALFTIDANTGALAFAAAPDYETQAPSYAVQVTASDGTNPTVQNITVNLTDVNDNAPVITSASTFSVAENTTAVGTVTATDADSPTVTFAITGGADQALFTIDANTGALAFAAAPDYETQAPSYAVQVTASDGTNPTVQNITVNLTDVNDNAPVITSASTFSVAENTTAVGTVTATDADSPTVTFAITGGADQALFTIDANTGALAFAAAPDYETQAPSYAVQVTASDGTNPTVQNITVNLTDVNDNAPVITSASTFSVAENTTAVGTVTATDADSPTVTFAITGGADQALFTIDANTGALAFAAAPDYETQAPSYAVQVTASDGTNPTVQNITVNLTDVNDNAPVITSASTFSVAENTTAVGTVTATDADSPTVTFAITGGADQALFTIDANTGALAFAAAPDYETQAPSYAVQVTASDGTNPTVQNITVNLTDVNDNAPVITSASTFSVAENTTAVGTVTATDADSPTVTFAITGGADQALFTIDANTGALAFAAAPDYETQAPSYAVQVTASDGTNPTVQNITVNLTDVNDNAPVITSASTFSVAENTTAVGTVTATDADSPTVTFAITGGADQALFTIDANTGALAFAAAPDYETQAPSYAVQVTASDGTNPTVQNITVNLTDVNDNAPVITSASTFSVAENTTAVGTVTATDADSPTVTFAITGGADQALFTIDANTGALAFAAAPDYETQAPSYAVQVTASDGTNPTVQNITVNLTDVNDNAPVITSASTFSVAENTTAVGTVTATDADSPTVTFAITGGADQALFTIDANTGALAFAAAPDYETQAPSYAVQVTASDGTNPTVQNITVNLTDVNDNAPVITSASTFSVAENTTAVGTVTATDADSPTVTFAITGGADQALFTIDANTGALAFAAAPDYETQAPSYAVQVTASDGTNPTVQNITVNLTDVNDNAPVITSASTFSVAENTTAVGTVTATDADSPTVTFAITGGADQALFTIDANTGALAFAAAPDYETQAPSYAVQVTASDGTNPTVQNITVNLTDVNDNAPVITSASTFSVAENTTAVGTVTATDADSPTVTFAITGGADQALFTIDANTGALAFAAAPDYETQAPSYAVQVTASDGTNPTVQNITVNLTDVNDNAPVITSASTFSVAENTTAVGTVTATDADSPTVTFAITGGADQALFTIDANTGALAFAAAPDYETQAPSYAVQVTASDGTNPTVQNITVNLTDVNDNAPVITSASTFSVAENTTAVGTVTATDADSPTVTFAITGGADQALFTIDANTGALAFAAAPDYETQAPSYAVQVTASDGTNPTVQNITVNLTDVNDNAPVITSASTFSVAENTTAVGTVTATDADSPTVTFAITGGADQALFTIDANTGALAFAAAPDYETQAPSYAVQVTASDGTNPTVQNITVNLTDVNDNAPVITSASTFSVAENTTAVGTVTATDADSPTVTFAITGGADQALFTIDANTGALAFAAAPDYETQAPSYAVQVTASDGTNPTVQNITVNLTDVNDNAPVITSASTFSVAENTTAVGTVTATDADSPTVTFAITGGADQALFTIDANTGALAFAAAPDYETQAPSYAVQVTASDGTNPTVQNITVNLTDVNDNAPVITSASTFSVAENTTAVGTVTATDADSPTVTFAITGGADQALFTIDANTGALAFAAAPDYETQAPSYAVQVTASDGTNPTVQNITVNLTDVNDNAPVITSASTFSVAENTTAVGTVTATDADSPTVTFAITGGADQALFTIDANTGALAFAAAPDYETQAPSYAVQVTASDGTNPTVQNITVNLTDVNDNAPVITSASTFSVAENTTAVGTVTATDADSPTVTFAITGGADQALFTIDANTGALAFAAAPDYETQAPSYAVQVTASDGTNPTVQNITVNLTDVNDNAPVITSASTFSVAENTTAVGTVTATDADSPTVTFAITGGADQALFTIDANTGALAFAAAPDYETQAPSYAVQVTASDGTNPTVQNITVNLTDVNDNAPVITSASTFSVAENTTAVGTVTATDADSPTVTFAITGGADQALFTIDANTGALAFAAAPDYETQAPSYAVQVTASDGTNPTVQNITVNLTDVNDNAPVITSASTFSVAENTTAVGTVTATDADSPTVTFAITGGADQALFTIDANTGALAFAAAPDYETQAPSYAVQVTASDGTNPTVQNITVNLTDVNDNAPVITSASTFSVAENTTAVGTVTATDADSPTVTFAITGGADQALFTIDANTGALAFAAAPDYETQAPSYAVQVTASDGTNPTVQNITVNLTDVNDNAPVITSASTFSVAENTTAVGTVTATDADSPTVTFAITGGADQALFTIDANTGALAFAAAPDYETQAPSYAVQVTASDGTNPTVQNITVNLTDQNEGPPPNSPPSITSNGAGPSSTSSVAENTTAITIVTATDPNGETPTYSISGGADAAKFSINALTGALAFASALDFETPTDAGADNHYEVIVRASDGSLFDEQTLTVNVTNVLGITVNGTSGNNVINGTGEEDILNGLGGNDQIHGLGGNDFINGGSGNDQLFGDAGNDTFLVAGTEALGDTFAGGSGNDAIQVTGSGVVTLAGFNATASSIETLQGNGQGVLGTSANNTFNLSGLTAMTGLAFIDGGSGNDLITGSSFADDLRGGSGNDTLNGGDGDDTIVGGPGTDTMDGGNDNDTFVIADTDGQNDIFNGGPGTDTMQVTGADAVTLAGFNASASSIETWQGNGQGLRGTSANNSFDLGALIAISSLLYVDGGGGTDTITGSSFADDLRGGSGNDTLDGGEGNDTLTGGTGNDTQRGGNGDDTFVIAGTEAQGDSFDGGGGTNRILVTGSGAVTLAGFNAATSSIKTWQGNGQALVGTSANNNFDLSALIAISSLLYVDGAGGADIISGSAFADDLRGGAGNDTLSGGEGNDTLTGGIGNDTQHGGNGNDTFAIAGTEAQGDIFEDDGGADSILVTGSGAVTLAGFDATASSIETWQGNGQGVVGTGAANTLNLSGLTTVSGLAFVDGGGGNDTITGSSLATIADDLRGGGASDTLNGLAGDDMLNGGAGNDTLDGGEGNDTLTGGTGNDTQHGGNGNDTFVIAGTDAQGDIFDGGLGTDSILVTGSAAVTLAGFDATSIETWQGNGQGVVGTGAANTFDFSGLTAVTGLAFVDGGGGNDTITGSSLAAIVDDLRGGGGNDTLNGLAGNDLLNGGAGNDTLIGGLGADMLNGGAGKDVVAYLSPIDGGDTIQGFVVKDDTIQISAAGFGGGLDDLQQLVAGTTFIANTTPTALSGTDGIGAFLYDTDGHDLLWDDDGSGLNDAQQIAHFDTAVALKADDFNIMA